MKQLYIYTFVLSLLCWGCTKQLNQLPQDQISSNIFWGSPNDALLELNGCYASLDGGYNNAYYEAYADNAFCQYPWESSATAVSAGSVNATLDGGYNSRYTGIRRFNYFLDNLDKTPGLSSASKKRYAAEVRFLRAFTYYNLTSLFGPTPLLKKSYADPSEAGKVPTAESEVITFVLSELDACIADLPPSYIGGVGNEKGRITKGAAAALAARVALNYGKNTEAVAYAGQVMGMGYSLYKKTQLAPSDMDIDYSNLVTFADDAAKTAFYKGLASYEQQFWEANDGNSEIILPAQNITNSSWQFGNGLNTLLLSQQWGGWSSITPTQELVNAYWQKDGSTFAPPTPADRAVHFNEGSPDAQWINEFKNRDTRLYASIVFPTSMMVLNDGTATEYAWAKGDSRTGYQFRKLVDVKTASTEADGAQDFPIIRYAEVLLIYAEAKNELSGPDQSIFDALNLIRDRAGMPNVNQTVYNSQPTLRDFIRQERRIELAGEGQRYDDIRRWKIGSSVMKNIHDISNGIVQERIWEDRFYLLPYPQTAVDHNPNLKAAQTAKKY